MTDESRPGAELRALLDPLYQQIARVIVVSAT